MIETLSTYPLLLLFIVAALGYFFGQISIKGNSLGVSAILFTGLIFGAIDSRLQIPEIIFQLGLTIFIYSIGLRSGPAFFNAYRRNGVRDFSFSLGMTLFSGLLAALVWMLFDFSAATTIGIYTGSTTNTAALAGVLEYVNSNFSTNEAADQVQQAVVGYSFSYPMGVLGGMIAIVLMENWFKIDYQAEKKALRKDYPVEEGLTSTTLKVTNEAIAGKTLRQLFKEYDFNAIFGRVQHNDEVRLSHWDIRFELGDIVMLVGNEEELKRIKALIGESTTSDMAYDRSKFDVRRIFVSNPDVAGRTVAELNISEKFNAIITRIRRGDMDMLATGDTVIEMGDRIRFTASREDLKGLSEFFGDSYYASSRVDLFSFGLGIGLGLILGTFEFTLSEDFKFKLGYAGGPLVVGLILGALRRTGPINWTLPYSANVTLQQIGLILLLTAIGVRSGNAFIESLSIEGIYFFLGGTFISLLTAIAILGIGFKMFKIPFSVLMGMVANQPAILEFAIARSKNNIPVFGYAMMFPIALIFKVLIAQLLYVVLL